MVKYVHSLPSKLHNQLSRDVSPTNSRHSSWYLRRAWASTFHFTTRLRRRLYRPQLVLGKAKKYYTHQGNGKVTEYEHNISNVRSN